jgi:hypothetical protein
VRANQWTVSFGYPSLATVHGVRSAASKILFGALARPRSVMGVCQSDLAPLTAGVPGSGTIAVYAWNGTTFVAAAPAMQFVGFNTSSEKIEAGTLLLFVESEGLWIAAQAGGADTTAVVRVYGGDADEQTCLWPGKIVAPGNDLEDACSYPFGDQEDCWLLVLNSSGGSWSTEKLSLTFDEHYVGKYVFSIDDVPVYAIRFEAKAAGIFRATLSGTLASADASGTVANVESLSGDEPPDIETVSNLLHLAGLNGDDCLIVEDTSGEEAEYYFLNIEHHECP